MQEKERNKKTSISAQTSKYQLYSSRRPKYFYSEGMIIICAYRHTYFRTITTAQRSLYYIYILPFFFISLVSSYSEEFISRLYFPAFVWEIQENRLLSYSSDLRCYRLVVLGCLIHVIWNPLMSLCFVQQTHFSISLRTLRLMGKGGKYFI